VGAEFDRVELRPMLTALTTDRADRPAFSGTDAATELRRLASQGAPERRTTDAVLEAAGHRQPLPKSRRPQHPGGLISREAEVLCLAARSLTTREIADRNGSEALAGLPNRAICAPAWAPMFEDLLHAFGVAVDPAPE
jgi:hypothetical protein